LVARRSADVDFRLDGPPGHESGTQSSGRRPFVDEIDAHRPHLAIFALDVHPLSGRRQHSDSDDPPPVLAEQPDLTENRKKDNRLWWLLIPLILLVAVLELEIAPFLSEIWTNIFPFLAEPQSRSLDALFVPEMHARWIGAWDFFALFVISSLFNNFLSEEFLFRGVLLPKMKGVFGKWDWVANGFIFGLYHLHMPWGIPGNILFGWLMAFTGKRYRSNWFPIILHNGQAFYFGFLILGLVLGLA
jgi:membrane protease YdiL (CAAX protease family)